MQRVEEELVVADATEMLVECILHFVKMRLLTLANHKCTSTRNETHRFVISFLELAQHPKQSNGRAGAHKKMLP